MLALLLALAGGPAAGQGMEVFAAHCASCHALAPGAPAGAGPNLAGVVGRGIGGDPGFDYSPALRRARAAGGVWTPARLAAFLADPEEAVPGTWMGNRLADPAAVAGVVAFLAGQGTGSSSD